MRTIQMNKLSLKRGASVTTEKDKPEKTQGGRTKPPSHPAYKDLGKIIRFLKNAGFKVRWHKPLSREIYKQLRSVIPSDLISSRRLYDAIGYHVRSIRYLMRLKAGDSRFNYKGQREGKVSATDEAVARKMLVEHHPRFMSWKRKTKNKILTATKPPRRPNEK